jgi:hypothetical protein
MGDSNGDLGNTDCTVTRDTDTISCVDQGTVSSGYSDTVYVVYNASLLALGTYTFTATVTSATPDPDTANNTVSMTCDVVTAAVINCVG